jgi:23S rRNA (uracil1939-C5)-methyltransferase
LTIRNLLHLTIEKMIYGGDGLARLPADEHGRGKAVFVPFVLPGEEIEGTLVEEKPGFARARVEQLLQPSPLRMEARCSYFQRCGGCHYQHTSYEQQLKIKTAILKENLRRIAKIELDQELKVHASPPWNYRNRSRLKLRHAPEFALGYYKVNSHELLPVNECPISSPLINRAIAALWELGRAGKIVAGMLELEIFANAEESQLLIEVYCAPDATPETAEPRMRELHESLQQNLPEVAGVVAFRSRPAHPSAQDSEAGSRLAVSGAEALTYQTESGPYRVSAGSFFQVNRHQIGKLVELVTVGRKGVLALDLYAGVGLFSTALARSFAQVIAVEPSQTSHTDLLHNSTANVKAVRATTEQYLQKVGGKLRPDLVVVDPPRSGLGTRVVRSLAELKSPRVAYVSCDPATLARDLGQLLGAGYRIEQAHLLDLFPQTYHLETVFHLAR